MAIAAALFAASCGGSSSSSGSSASSESIRGQTITVLVPYVMPQKLLNQFTAETGVNVNYVRTGWDATHNKLIVANTAKTYIADVAEFDWSFTGQFAGAGWVEPLDNLLPAKTLADLKNTDAAFVSGGKTYAACYSNDFRMSMYNKQMFAKAGITSFPATFDELATDVQKLQASGVKYPLQIPMAATEGGITPWYLLTLAMGGQLFDQNLKPVFQTPGSAGYKALQWEADAVKNGWVSPGLGGVERRRRPERLPGGTERDPARDRPRQPAHRQRPQPVQHRRRGGARPGAGRRPARAPRSACRRGSRSRSPPSTRRPPRPSSTGGSSPRTRSPSTRRRAACRAGPPPSSRWSATGQLQGGDVLNQELSHVGPLFQAGAPIWYSQFSADAQGLNNAAVKGQMSVQDALNQLAAKASARTQ